MKPAKPSVSISATTRPGRPPGTGRPLDADLAALNDNLRQHLAMSAIVGQPERGTRFAHYYAELNALPAFAIPDGKPRAGRPGPRLKRWWDGTQRVMLTRDELAACWRWLLPQ